MLTARVIRYNSGLAPAGTLRAFRFYPIAFTTQQRHALCRPHFPPVAKAYPKSVAAQSVLNYKQELLKPTEQKNFRKHSWPGYQSYVNNLSDYWRITHKHYITLPG